VATYYISYGEPESRFNWRTLLLILLGLLALAILAGIAYGIFLLVTGEDDSGIVAPANASEGVPLAEALPALFDDDTNTVFLVDNSKTISGSLSVVQQALLAVVLPYADPNAGRPAKNSMASLALFTDVPEPFPELASLESLEISTKWLHTVDTLNTIDRPAYIYDAVGAAHDALVFHGDTERDNVIVLLTDGGDGGFAIVDPARAELCGPGIERAPGEVCNPVFETITINPAGLVPCPQDMAVRPGEVCDPVSVATVGETITAYHPVHPDEVEPCPAELGGPSNACVDIITGYQPFHPDAVQTCPAALDEPGKACVEFTSKLTQDELLAILVSSEVHNLKVHTIGLGEEADHDVLKLLAEATGGEYVYADASSVSAMNLYGVFAGSRLMSSP
jgi:hypothetical protein